MRSIAPVKKNTAAPSKDITDHARPRRSEQVAAHRRKQQPTDRDLALLHRNAIAGDSQRNRKDAACGDACQHTERHQCLEIRGQPAGNVATPTISMQSAIKRVLLNMSAKRAEYRLDERVRQCEAG